MNHYHIKIDGKEAPERYTYEELLMMGVLDFDDNEIQIRQKSNGIWRPVKDFKFPEEESSGKYSVDEFGQIVRKEESSASNYTINENGEIVRPDVPNRSTSSSSTRPSSSSSRTSSSSSSSGSNHSSDTDWGEIGEVIIKVILTIGVIALAIALSAASIGIVTPILAIAGYKAIQAIWDWD